MRRSIVICLIFRYRKIKLDEQHMQPRHGDLATTVFGTSEKHQKLINEDGVK